MSVVAAAATLNAHVLSRGFEISRVVYQLLRSNDDTLTIYRFLPAPPVICYVNLLVGDVSVTVQPTN